MSDDLPQTSTSAANGGSTTAPDGAQSNNIGTSAGDGSNVPRTGVEGKIMQPPSWPVMAGLVAAVAAVLALLRAVVTRRKPTPDERLSEATHALGAAAVGLGGRAAKRATSVTEPVVRDAASRAADVAQDAAARAADVAQDAAGIAAEGARKVAAVGAAGIHEVAEGAEAVQRVWSKFLTRLIIVVFGGAGYVLGARAGRERYDQIMSAAQRVQGAAKH
jgi:hypothetical protein